LQFVDSILNEDTIQYNTLNTNVKDLKEELKDQLHQNPGNLTTQ